MDYFKKLSEKRLIRKVKNLREKSGEPIVINLHKSVLYRDDAFRIICYYAGLVQTDLPQDFAFKSDDLRIMFGANNDENHYWYYRLNDLYYTIQIGEKSKLSIGKAICSPYIDHACCFGYFEIPLKDCKWQLYENAQLYAYFMTGKDDLKPIALMLHGKDIDNIDHSVWATRVDFREEESVFKDFDRLGRKGGFQDVWLPPMSFRVVYTWEEAQYLPLSTKKESWWTGEKIIRHFRENEKPSLQDMRVIWEVFLKSV